MLHAAHVHPYPTRLRQRLLRLAQGDGRIKLDTLGALDVEVARCFAQATRRLLDVACIDRADVLAIGSHGQTIRHRPGANPPFTMQIGDPNVIAENTGICTVADFRRRDVAANGQGAPLAPLFHAAMLPRDDAWRVVLNLGGIANVTLLEGKHLRGFDTGPASCLMDAWSQLQLGQPFDRDGRFAARGTVDEALLASLLADPFFAQAPPKSTGREYFNLDWLHSRANVARLDPANVQATLLALSARSIADAIASHAPQAREVLACGGGVHNLALRKALQHCMPHVQLHDTQVIGINPDYVEAMAFAWLARERLAGRPIAGLSEVTGARASRVLGGIYFGD